MQKFSQTVERFGDAPSCSNMTAITAQSKVYKDTDEQVWLDLPDPNPTQHL